MAETKGDLQAELAALKEDLSKVRGDLRNIGDELLTRGKASARAAKEAVGAKFENSVEAMQNCIEERPVTCVLVAFGAGLVLGKLLGFGRR